MLLLITFVEFVVFFFQRQLDSESSKVSSKKAMEKIEMLNNRRQEVSIGQHLTYLLNFYWGKVALWLVHSPLDLSLSPCQGHCVVFSGETLLLPGEKWFLQNFMLRITLPNELTSYPRESRILLVALCYKNWDKLWPDGPLGSYADGLLFYIASVAVHVSLFFLST